MTPQDLEGYGYKPIECKIGVLYFHKSGIFFCHLKDDGAHFYLSSEDEFCRGIANTIEELRELEKAYYLESFKYTRTLAAGIHGVLVEEYGMDPNDPTMFDAEVKAFSEANNDWYNTSFDPAVDRVPIFLKALNGEWIKKDAIGAFFKRIKMDEQEYVKEKQNG